MELTKKGTDGKPSEEYTVWTEGSTLYWVHVKYGVGRNQVEEDEESFATPAEAERAEQERIADLVRQGYAPTEEAPEEKAPPMEPSRATPGAVKPAWFGALPEPLVAQHQKLAEMARARGLGHRFAEIEARMRPGIDLVLKKASLADLEGVVSRLGGPPDLPPGQAWPTWSGVPLTFLAQIVITADIKALDLEGILPEGGILSFFAHLESPDYGDHGAVLHAPTTKGLVRTAPPTPACALKEVGVLEPEPRLTIAQYYMPTIEELGLSREERRAYNDDLFLGSLPEGPRHMLLGWPDATTRHDSKRRRFLAQLDSDDRIGFEMGDVDTLRFYIDGDVVNASSLASAVCTLDEA